MIRLTVYNKTRTQVPQIVFLQLLKPAFKNLILEKRLHKAKDFLIELTLIGNRRMQILNRRFHKKNRPTDVISISYFSEKTDDNLVGEIFINIPYAKRQARKIRQSFNEELRFLFIHGLLHVFGYDHKKAADEEHMKKLTYRILGRI